MKWVQSARLSITKTKLKKVQTLDHRFSNLILKRTLVVRDEDIQAVVAALFDQQKLERGYLKAQPPIALHSSEHLSNSVPDHLTKI